MTWATILQLGVVTAVLTQLLGFLFDRVRSYFAEAKDAKIIALLMSVSLEKFAIECADVIAGNDLHRSSKGAAGRSVNRIPDFPNLLPSETWKILDAGLAARAARMPNERMLGEGQIDFWWDVTGELDDVGGATDNECGRCGYLAWMIAYDLRAKYKLPQIEAKKLSWDFVDLLRKHHDYAVKLIAEREKESS